MSDYVSDEELQELRSRHLTHSRAPLALKWTSIIADEILDSSKPNWNARMINDCPTCGVKATQPCRSPRKRKRWIVHPSRHTIQEFTNKQ